MKQEQPILIYDESEIIENEIKFKMEEDNEDNKTEEEIREIVYNDYDLFTFQWDFLKEELTEVMHRLNKRNFFKTMWKASVNNFGWRNQDGFKTFHAETGEELLRAILPETDCTFRIFKYGRNGIKIQNFHHDSPTGNEWYYIKPMTIKEVEEDGKSFR